MSEQMQEVIGMAVSRAYEAGANYERSKALITVEALLHDAQRRLLDLSSKRGKAGYIRAVHEIKTEIRVYEDLQRRIHEQA